MTKTAWEIIIRKCPHCNKDLSIHHRSTIDERHLMNMIFRDLNFHLVRCDKKVKKSKLVRVEMETESVSNNLSAKLYKTNFLKLML